MAAYCCAATHDASLRHSCGYKTGVVFELVEPTGAGFRILARRDSAGVRLITALETTSRSAFHSLSKRSPRCRPARS